MKALRMKEALRRIQSLDLPPLIERVNRKKPVPNDLDLTFGYPYQIYLTPPDALQLYGGDIELTPLWTNAGSDGVVAYRHDPPEGFIRFDLEDPGDDSRFTTVHSWGGILLKEFIGFWEGDRAEEWMREVARELRFQPIEPLLAEMSSTDLSTTEAFETWRESFRTRYCSL